MRTRIVCLLLMLFSSAPAQADLRFRHLSAGEIDRVREMRQLLSGVDHKTLAQEIRELEKTGKPYLNLELREAMARAYADIARQYDVRDSGKKAWLYSMVCLNMAYLQFAGGQSSDQTTSLNRLIRQEIKKYLPPDVFNQAGFSYSM